MTDKLTYRIIKELTLSEPAPSGRILLRLRNPALHSLAAITDAIIHLEAGKTHLLEVFIEEEIKEMNVQLDEDEECE